MPSVGGRLHVYRDDPGDRCIVSSNCDCRTDGGTELGCATQYSGMGSGVSDEVISSSRRVGELNVAAMEACLNAGVLSGLIEA